MQEGRKRRKFEKLANAFPSARIITTVRVEYHANGIYLPDIDLWLDPKAAVGNAWLSHAHSDHARGVHAEVWGTPNTLAFYQMRWNVEGSGQIQHPIEYAQSAPLAGATLTALPAGHILGAAQLLVEFEGERLVYTGDIKLRPPLCGTPTEVVPCDRLIIESTFGLPIYHFLTCQEACDRMVAFARECLEDRAVPVFLGYPLGRGQEVAHALATAGIPVSVHGAIARYLPQYEAAGYAFPGWQRYASGKVEGRALVVTPSMRAVLEASSRDYRIAYVSGWAALHNARARVGAQELIPYSDHAGFDELIEMVELSGASRVDLVHGYTEPLARLLRQRGVDAHAPAAAAAREAEDAEAESGG